jgi:hypothetical protein
MTHILFAFGTSPPAREFRLKAGVDPGVAIGKRRTEAKKYRS